MRYQANNFTIETPDDWRDRSIITFAAPGAPNDFAPNIVITREPVGVEINIEDYAQRQFDITRREVVGMKILGQKTTLLGGRPAVEIVQQLSAHNRNLQQLQIFVLIKQEICIITCTTTAGSFNQHLPRFRRILDSFQVNS